MYTDCRGEALANFARGARALPFAAVGVASSGEEDFLARVGALRLILTVEGLTLGRVGDVARGDALVRFTFVVDGLCVECTDATEFGEDDLAFRDEVVCFSLVVLGEVVEGVVFFALADFALDVERSADDAAADGERLAGVVVAFALTVDGPAVVLMALVWTIEGEAILKSL